MFLAIGVANTIQFTWEADPIPEDSGADWMMGIIYAIMLTGMFVHIRGMMLENWARSLKSKELAVSSVIYRDDILKEEEEMT